MNFDFHYPKEHELFKLHTILANSNFYKTNKDMKAQEMPDEIESTIIKDDGYWTSKTLFRTKIINTSEPYLILNGVGYQGKEKPEVKKDFDWYIEEYCKGIHFMESHKMILVRDYFKNGEFEKVRYEFRIGLFKFICDELSLNYVEELSGINTFKKDKIGYPSRGNISINNVHIPVEFINSLLK